MGKDKKDKKGEITPEQTPTPKPKIPVKLTEEEMMQVLNHFIKRNDFINAILTTKKFKEIPKKYKYNPISIDQKSIDLFPNIEKQILYAWNDIQIPEMKKYEVAYQETYFHYYLKYFAIRDKISAKHVVYSAEDRVNYECMKGDGNIPENITQIADKCFEECNKLKSLKIPNTVTSIGRNVFSNCTSLTGLTLSENLKSIGDNCFLACNSLCSVKIGKLNEFHGRVSYGVSLVLQKNKIKCTDVFYSIEDRRKFGVKIPDVCNSLADKCFAQCQSLTSIEIPSTISYIGSYCFEGCKGLKNVSLPSTVKSYDHAFAGCSCISSLTIYTPL